MKFKKVVFGVFAICIAFCCVFTGCSSSDNWVRNTISRYYYRFDGDYSELEDMSGLTIEEMVAKLDPYSAYYTREEYEKVEADNAGSKSGIGISYAFSEGQGAVIYSVVGNSPARKAGLKAGDVVVSAQKKDGTVVNFEKSSDFSEFITARGEGEKFTFNFSDGRTAELAKAQYTASYVSMYTSEKTYEIEYEDDERSVVETEGGIEQLPAGVAYMYMYQFFGGAAEEIGELLAKFNAAGCTSLILDLRDNGGGYVDLMAQIGGRFTYSLEGSPQVAMIARFKDGTESFTNCPDYKASGVEKRYNLTSEEYMLPSGADVYVMANHNTASASEALIGVLVSYGILQYENIFLSKYGDSPAKSYGKGIMQSVFTNYITGERLKLTVAGIYWQNGRTIHGAGLAEDDGYGCSVAPASDDIVNIGYDDELVPIIQKILSDRATN